MHNYECKDCPYRDEEWIESLLYDDEPEAEDSLQAMLKDMIFGAIQAESKHGRYMQFNGNKLCVFEKDAGGKMRLVRIYEPFGF